MSDYLSKFGINGTHLGDYVPGWRPTSALPVPCVCCGDMHDGEKNGPCETCDRQGCDALTIRH